MIVLLPIAWVLLHWRRQGKPERFVLGAYLIITGTLRFMIEFLRMRESMFGPFAVAHLASFAAVCAGLVLLCSTSSDVAATDARA
jgi:prolipoprotein diacylglyceryltransferase